MKLTELVLIIILAIILTVSKVSDSLHSESIKITEGKAVKHKLPVTFGNDSIVLNEMNVILNKKTQEITFVNNVLPGSIYHRD